MKKKHFKEGVDYTIHEYKRKKKRTSEKAICPICSQCKNRRWIGYNKLDKKDKDMLKLKNRKWRNLTCQEEKEENLQKNLKYKW